MYIQRLLETWIDRYLYIFKETIRDWDRQIDIYIHVHIETVRDLDSRYKDRCIDRQIDKYEQTTDRNMCVKTHLAEIVQ